MFKSVMMKPLLISIRTIRHVKERLLTGKIELGFVTEKGTEGGDEKEGAPGAKTKAVGQGGSNN